ncbi:MAG: SusC/RagA family TonB-linked outer membrane protein [Chitinophagaceae bacterium]|nr:SusC/RagA family TonB-linked outer membrane protein [Chitinophagaceae bacterium]
MKKRRAGQVPAVLKFLLIMKLTLFLIFCFSTQVFSAGFAQDRINVTIKNVEMKKAISIIQRVSLYRFLYNDDILPKKQKVSLTAKDATIQQVLNDLLSATNLTYRIMNQRLIVISSTETNTLFTVSGTVRLRDRDGNLSTTAGIVVNEVGQSNAAVTNDQGAYSINVTNENASLEFSHVGYRSITVNVSGRGTIDAQMEPDVQQLTDVVVTALGISRQKKSLTYSTQSIKGDDLSNSRQVNITSAMTGRVAGLTINKTNSGPGGSNRILFRGNRSIAGTNQPLIIVDGVRIDNDAKAFADVALFGGRDNGDGISNINPDDVESMSVLTGVSAAALYGSDAANGAIIITTKKGAARKGIGIQLSSSATMEKVMIFPDMQNEYGQGNAGIFVAKNENSWGPRMTGQEVADWTGKTQALTPQPSNSEDFFKTGNELVNSIALSGGSEKAQTYFSYTNTLSKGIIPNNEYKRNNFNLRQFVNLTDKLTLDVKANYIVEDIQNRPLSGAANRAVSTILSMPRSLRLPDIKNYETQNPDGTITQNYWAIPAPAFQNPYWSAYRNLYQRKRNRIIGLVALKYQFTPELSLQVRNSIDYYADNSEEKDYNDSYWLTDYVGQGNYVVNKESNRQLNSDVLLNFNKSLTDRISLNVNAGASLEKFNFERSTLNNQGLNAPNLFATANAISLSNEQFPYFPYQPIVRTERQSVYGAAQLSFNDYLFLDVTGRNDWNSTLPVDNASYFFPSAGISGIISDMLTMPSFISYLKLRTSYALVGNGTGFNNLKPTFFFVPGGNGGFLNIDRTLKNANLKPEQTRSFEAGLDFSLFSNRLSVEATYYKTNTRNQILRIPVPDPSGYSSRIINAGNIQNSGVELLLFAKPVDEGLFKWNISATFGANKNRVISLDSLSKEPLLSSPQAIGSIRVVEGGKYGELFTASLQRNASGEIVVGNDGLPLIVSDQNTYVGNYNPDWTGGITNTFQLGNFSVSILIDMRKGGKVLSGTQMLLASKGVADYTAANREQGFVIENSVKEDGSKNTTPVTSEQYWTHVTQNSVGELFAYDATNARLREASITYSLPARLISKSIVNSASISLIGRNLFFITNKADGFDPESSLGTGNNQGIEYASIPSTRSIGVHLKVNF